MGDGSSCFRAYRLLGIEQHGHEMTQHVSARDRPAADESDGAVSAERARGIDPASEDRLHLDVSKTAKVRFRFVMTEFTERLNQRVLSPALGIVLLEKSRVCGEQFGDEL